MIFKIKLICRNYNNIPARLKRKYHKEAERSRGGRFDNKGPCGDRRTWEFATFLLSSRNRNDICMAQPLLGPFGLKDKLILADRVMTTINLLAG